LLLVNVLLGDGPLHHELSVYILPAAVWVSGFTPAAAFAGKHLCDLHLDLRLGRSCPRVVTSVLTLILFCQQCVQYVNSPYPTVEDQPLHFGHTASNFGAGFSCIFGVDHELRDTCAVSPDPAADGLSASDSHVCSLQSRSPGLGFEMLVYLLSVALGFVALFQVSAHRLVSFAANQC